MHVKLENAYSGPNNRGFGGLYSTYSDATQLVTNCPHAQPSHIESNFKREEPSNSSDTSCFNSEVPASRKPTGARAKGCSREGHLYTLTAEGEHPLETPAETGYTASGPLLMSRQDAFDFDVTELKSSGHISDSPPSLRDPSRAPVLDPDLPEHVNLLFLQTVENSDLSVEVTRDLKTVLYDHRETFGSSSTDLGFCSLLEHDIDTGDSRPIKQSPRRPPLAAREAEDEILEHMMSSGVIEPSNSSWASPVCLVRKKDGTFRFCID